MGGQGAKAGSIAYADDGSTPTIKSAPSGGNTVPDVVYPINTMVATRGGKDDGRTTFGVGEANDPQFTLGAAHEHAVCYAIEGNVVDREAKQNGMGVSRDQSPTLNGQDKHAVAFQSCGDRDNPSVSVSDKAYCIPANPMSDRQQAVCFQQNQREEVRDMGGASGALSAEPGSHQQNYVCYKQSGFADYEEGVGTLKASGGDVGGELKASSSRIYDARGNGDGSTTPNLISHPHGGVHDYEPICVQKVFENHSQDSRYTGPVNVSQTVSATFGMGGNNQPFVVKETAIMIDADRRRADYRECEKSPTLTAKMGTWGGTHR